MFSPRGESSHLKVVLKLVATLDPRSGRLRSKPWSWTTKWPKQVQRQSMRCLIQRRRPLKHSLSTTNNLSSVLPPFWTRGCRMTSTSTWIDSSRYLKKISEDQLPHKRSEHRMRIREGIDHRGSPRILFLVPADSSCMRLNRVSGRKFVTWSYKGRSSYFDLFEASASNTGALYTQTKHSAHCDRLL